MFRHATEVVSTDSKRLSSCRRKERAAGMIPEWRYVKVTNFPSGCMHRIMLSKISFCNTLDQSAQGSPETTRSTLSCPHSRASCGKSWANPSQIVTSGNSERNT